MGYRVPSVLRPRRAAGRAPWGLQDPDPCSASPGSLRPGPEDFLPRVGRPAPTFRAPAPDKLLWFPPPCLNEGMDALFSLHQLPNATLLSLENGRH